MSPATSPSSDTRMPRFTFLSGLTYGTSRTRRCAGSLTAMSYPSARNWFRSQLRLTSLCDMELRPILDFDRLTRLQAAVLMVGSARVSDREERVGWNGV